MRPSIYSICRQISRLTLLTALSAMILSSCGGNNYVSITGFAQGSTYEIKVNLDGVDKSLARHPQQIKERIDSILTAIDNSLSGYNKGSLLSRLNSGETIVPDEIFADMYNISRDFYELTEGAFDVAAGPLFDIWGFGFSNGDFPTDSEVDSVRAECGMRRLRADIRDAIAEDGTLNPRDLLTEQYAEGRLPLLNYNAIAQGYSCDLVAGYLRSIGVKDMLVMLGGGELYCNGVNPSGNPWTIGVDKPVDGNDIPGAMLEGTVTSGGKPCGIVTSGNYRKYYIIDGKKYAHTIDPRTGSPVSHNLLSATIMAEDATAADAIATYCMVIGFEESVKFIEAHDELEGYLIYDKSAESGETNVENETEVGNGNEAEEEINIGGENKTDGEINIGEGKEADEENEEVEFGEWRSDL